MSTEKIKITVTSKSLTEPVREEIVTKAIDLLNKVLNTEEFKALLTKQEFYCSNRPGFGNSEEYLSGEDVYSDLLKVGKIQLQLIVKPLWNPWRRFISNTLGATNIHSNVIVTYTWWLPKEHEDLIIKYATHVGHELFHTSYFQYVHDPPYGSRNFLNEKDVIYKIDDIIETLILQYYKE